MAADGPADRRHSRAPGAPDSTPPVADADAHGEWQSPADAAVRIRQDGSVRTLVLNRPDRLNALDAATTIELTQALRRADQDASTRVVVITGAGRAFCAGGDVETMNASPRSERLGHRDLELHQVL